MSASGGGSFSECYQWHFFLQGGLISNVINDIFHRWVVWIYARETALNAHCSRRNRDLFTATNLGCMEPLRRSNWLVIKGGVRK